MITRSDMIPTLDTELTVTDQLNGSQLLLAKTAQTVVAAAPTTLTPTTMTTAAAVPTTQTVAALPTPNRPLPLNSQPVVAAAGILPSPLAVAALQATPVKPTKTLAVLPLLPRRHSYA